jgi:hypothetical protein
MTRPSADSSQQVMADAAGAVRRRIPATFSEARRQLCDGLPLPADTNVAGYLARKPEGAQRV